MASTWYRARVCESRNTKRDLDRRGKDTLLKNPQHVNRGRLGRQTLEMKYFSTTLHLQRLSPKPPPVDVLGVLLKSMFSPSVRLSTVALFRLRKHSWSESNSRSPAAEWLSKSLTVRVDPN
eukprot:3973427-Pyramimonas_sp.AAC.1